MEYESRLTELKKLIDTFRNNFDSYKKNSYKEENTKSEFIDKFFKLLGWDVYNEGGNAEAYKDVVREDSVKIDGKMKAPDYSFRIGGAIKFFVEAKKPSEDIKTEVRHALQVRRYAYTEKLALSILTDFEEFAVYDTRIKVDDKKDKAATARIFYCTYEEYDKKFEFIYNTFSKDAILKGSFDKYVLENKNKKGTSRVDDTFLQMIDSWRVKLAMNIAIRNKELSIHELNYAVQKIIDRIIFLRIAEDRGSENYGQLKSILDKENIYAQLVEIFKNADQKYNSGLFENEKFLNEIVIDNEIFKGNSNFIGIISNLYYPNCPFEFSVLRVDILGHVYEQFLGKTIRLTPSHRAKIELKPEVRKAGGVYYTPQYIVKYIVENTVGKKLEGLTPEKASSLKILDPACGSGSFLIGVCEYLLNWHYEYYTSKRLDKSLGSKEPPIYQVRHDKYRLTLREKKRILVNNIFGVDIDTQAVEVTKLSLLLKMLEGEMHESAGQLFSISEQEKILPNLGENIKCGNSLVGSDFYDDKDLSLFEDEAMRKVNVFDWEKEFPAIFERGGFDCVIGNPPWVSSKSIDISFKNYFLKYKTSGKQYDLFCLFTEISQQLLKEDGLHSFIVPSRFFTGVDYYNFRKLIFDDFFPVEIFEVGENIFAGVDMPSVVYIFSKIKRDYVGYKYVKGHILDNHIVRNNIKISDIKQDEKLLIKITADEMKIKLLNKINSNSQQLANFVSNARGVEIGKTSPAIEKENGEGKYRFLVGGDISRYQLKFNNNFINTNIKDIDYKKPELYSGEKILLRKTGHGLNATLDTDNHWVIQVIYIFKILEGVNENIRYLLGVINSKLMYNYYYETFGEKHKEAFPHFRQTQFLQLPIIKISSANQNIHDEIVSLVDSMIETQKKIHSAKMEREKENAQKKADIIDAKIDKLVYELYGLTDEEIQIVEAGV